MNLDPSLDSRTPYFARNLDLEDLLGDLNGLLESTKSIPDTSVAGPSHPVVFIMGNARSGTTLLLQALGYSGAFAYPTNLLSRFYGSPIVGALVQQMLQNPKYAFRGEFDHVRHPLTFQSDLGKTQGIFSSNVFWYYFRRFFSPDNYQGISQVSWANSDTDTFSDELKRLTCIFDKPFALKGMYLNWNILDLISLDPTFFIIYVERDYLHNISSILRARHKFFGDLSYWWSFKPDQFEKIKDLDPFEQVTGQVFFTNLAVKRALRKIGADRVLHLTYDALCRDPHSVIRQARSLIGEEIDASAIDQIVPKNFNESGGFSFSDEDKVRCIRFHEKLSTTFE